ncbi:hypothetical protein BDZ45DRAFT_693657 [Acephala macrosclerotiorum]|nr:hypothetical protein BDZ45DRAFT_693657 [Acephala macrosclerotiorum]
MIGVSSSGCRKEVQQYEADSELEGLKDTHWYGAEILRLILVPSSSSGGSHPMDLHVRAILVMCMQLSMGAKRQVLKMLSMGLFQDFDDIRNLGVDNDTAAFSVNSEASHISCAVHRLKWRCRSSRRTLSRSHCQVRHGWLHPDKGESLEPPLENADIRAAFNCDPINDPSSPRPGTRSKSQMWRGDYGLKETCRENVVLEMRADLGRSSRNVQRPYNTGYASNGSSEIESKDVK